MAHVAAARSGAGEGEQGAASALGIDPGTVASCMKTGRLSWRVREALERGLQSEAGSTAARQRERNDALVRLMLTRDLSAAMRQGEWRLAQFEERMCG